MFMSLWRLIVGLWAVLCLLVGGAYGLGHIQSPGHALSLNPPGCELPCLLGIVPGLTTESHTARILDKISKPIDPTTYWERILNGTGYYLVTYYQGDNYGRITELDIKGEPLLTLGDLERAGYLANRVSVGTIYDNAGLFFVMVTFIPSHSDNESIVVLAHSSSTVSPDDQVSEIRIMGANQSHDADFGQMLFDYDGYDFTQWSGYRPVADYILQIYHKPFNH